MVVADLVRALTRPRIFASSYGVMSEYAESGARRCNRVSR